MVRALPVILLVLGAMSPLSADGIDAKAAARYSERHGGKILLIWNNGQKETFGSLPADRAVDVFSITKSLTALAWLSRATANREIVPAKGKWPAITAGDLLSQTSGLTSGSASLYGGRLRDLDAAAARVPRAAPPGEQFTYGPSHWELLGTVPLTDPMGLLASLGIRPAGWRRDRTGRAFLSAGAQLTAGDLLRVGRLILDRGRASWIQQTIPPDRLEAAFRGSRANPAYGQGFWLNARATSPQAVEWDVEEALRAGLNRARWQNVCLSKGAPADLVAMAGSGGQRVYMVPSRRLVVVRFGNGKTFRDPEFLDALFSSRRPRTSS